MGPEIRRFIPKVRNFEYSDAVVAERRIRVIDVDPARKLVYWTDTSLRTIKRAVIPEDQLQLGAPQDLQIEGMRNPNGLAFDWVAQ